MSFDRARADNETARDLVVAEAVGDEREHLELAAGQILEARDASSGLGSADELTQLGHEPGPGGLVLEENVVVALEREEACAPDPCREQTALLERDDRVTAWMDHEHGNRDVVEEVDDVDLAPAVAQAHGRLGADGEALELVEPLELLRRRAGDEAAREDSAEGRVRPPPPHSDEVAEQHGLVALLPCRVAL